MRWYAIAVLRCVIVTKLKQFCIVIHFVNSHGHYSFAKRQQPLHHSPVFQPQNCIVSAYIFFVVIGIDDKLFFSIRWTTFSQTVYNLTHPHDGSTSSMSHAEEENSAISRQSLATRCDFADRSKSLDVSSTVLRLLWYYGEVIVYVNLRTYHAYIIVYFELDFF